MASYEDVNMSTASPLFSVDCATLVCRAVDLQGGWVRLSLGIVSYGIHSVLVRLFVHLEDRLPSTEGGGGYKASVMVMFKWETSNVLPQQMGIYRPDEFHHEN